MSESILLDFIEEAIAMGERAEGLASQVGIRLDQSPSPRMTTTDYFLYQTLERLSSAGSWAKSWKSLYQEATE